MLRPRLGPLLAAGLSLSSAPAFAGVLNLSPIEVQLKAGDLPPGDAAARLVVSPPAGLESRLRFRMPDEGPLTLRFFAEQVGPEASVEVQAQGANGATFARRLDATEVAGSAPGPSLQIASRPDQFSQVAQRLSEGLRGAGVAEAQRQLLASPRLVAPESPLPECAREGLTLWIDTGVAEERRWLRCAAAGSKVLFVGLPSARALRDHRPGDPVGYGQGFIAWIPDLSLSGAELVGALDRLASVEEWAPFLQSARGSGEGAPRLHGLKATFVALGLAVVAVLLLGLWAGRKPRRALWLWPGLPAILLLDGLGLMIVARPAPGSEGFGELRVSRLSLLSPDGDGTSVLVAQARVDGERLLAFDLPLGPGSAPLEVRATDPFGSPFAIAPPTVSLIADLPAARLRVSQLRVPRRGEALVSIETPLSGVPVLRLVQTVDGFEVDNPTAQRFDLALVGVERRLGVVTGLGAGARLPVVLGDQPPEAPADVSKELWSSLSSSVLGGSLPPEGYLLAGRLATAPLEARLDPALPSRSSEVRVVIGTLPGEAGPP